MIALNIVTFPAFRWWPLPTNYHYPDVLYKVRDIIRKVACQKLSKYAINYKLHHLNQ